MRDVTPLMDSYRECARHLWNTYFQHDAEAPADWDLQGDFDFTVARLFRALVLAKVRHGDVEVLPDNCAPRTPMSFLHVTIAPRSAILVNRERAGGYWDHPLTAIETGDLDLRFLQYFDWAVLGFRDFAYYRVRIVGSAKIPDVVGKDALVPVGVGVKILCEAAAEQ